MGDVHTTTAPASITYSSVVSKDSVRISLTIATVNGLDILAYDMQDDYLTSKCRELIWTTAGPKFGLDEGSIMVVKIDIYGLKSSGSAFRSKLVIILHNIEYTPSKAYLDVWMMPVIKLD